MDEIELLKSVGCPDWVIEHSKGVSRKAVEIARNFDNVDVELVRVGGLLHDIGRSKTSSIEHAVIGARMLEDMGYSKEIANIVERHIGTGLDEDDARELGLPVKSYVPQTFEEKIVSHADNLFNGSQEIDVEFRVDNWKMKLGKDHPSIDQFIKNHEELVERFNKD